MNNFNTVGCCGIDCGLCPRFYTKGDSVCPGCNGDNFKEKHPSCGILSCCLSRGYEVCSYCSDFPCKKYDPGIVGRDSFVTHRKMLINLKLIRKEGIEVFIKEQRKRIVMLKHFLENFDDGRSKSFFCISCALLPLGGLEEARIFADGLSASLMRKEKNRLLKEALRKRADSDGSELKLNSK